MPSQYSSEHSIKDARELACKLGIRFEVVPIGPIFDGYRKALAPVFAGTPENVTEENIQSRIRGNILMALSNKFGELVLTTGNKIRGRSRLLHALWRHGRRPGRDF